MKLVVGLGNPGRKYEETRHNVGFEVLEELARRGGGPARKQNFQGEVTEVNLGAERCLLLWPWTYMNRSGGSVVRARDFYKLANADLLVVCDDFHLPLGKLRLRAAGSAGGQRGLEDIIRALGSDEVARLRVGIGEPPPQFDPADFVLSKFAKADRPIIEETYRRAADAVEAWAREGLAAAANRFN